jgi:hypothetical protein
MVLVNFINLLAKRVNYDFLTKLLSCASFENDLLKVNSTRL